MNDTNTVSCHDDLGIVFHDKLGIRLLQDSIGRRIIILRIVFCKFTQKWQDILYQNMEVHDSIQKFQLPRSFPRNDSSDMNHLWAALFCYRANCIDFKFVFRGVFDGNV